MSPTPPSQSIVFGLSKPLFREKEQISEKSLNDLQASEGYENNVECQTNQFDRRMLMIFLISIYELV
jgi:hypothetical protein